MSDTPFSLSSPSPAPVRTAREGAMRQPAAGLSDRMVRAGLLGAGALTMTWWTLLACGLWLAVEWAGA